MSEIFHKSCYTARSSGYKYRTLSTNTGERKQRDSREDNAFERKFRELRRAILTRLNKELNETHKARDTILQKFGKLDAKIDSMIELQDTVMGLRKDVQSAGYMLSGMINKVENIETISLQAELLSLQSQRASFRSPPIKEETEDNDSIVTHI